MASPPFALTITADDFGVGPETSRGIVDAFLAGAISRASVMTGTGDRLDRSLETLARAPKLPLGLHLTLTGEASTPLVAKRSSGLVTRDGRFHSLPQLAFRCALRRVDDAAIEDEILAQAERFRALLGKAPNHVDGHHHAHQLPVISRVLSEIVSRSELPRRIRNTIEPRELRAVPGARTRRAVIHGLGVRSRVEFQSVRAAVPDGFFGVLSPEMLAHARDPTVSPWSAYLAALPQKGNYEMMVHPGHPDPELAGRDGYVAERQLELAALLALGPKILARA